MKGLRPRSVRGRTVVAGLVVLGLLFAGMEALLFLRFLAPDIRESGSNERVAAMVVAVESGVSPQEAIVTIEDRQSNLVENCHLGLLAEDRSPLIGDLPSQIQNGPQGVVNYTRLAAPAQRRLAGYVVSEGGVPWQIAEAEAQVLDGDGTPGANVVVVDACPSQSSWLSQLGFALPVLLIVWLSLMAVSGLALFWASRRALASVESIRKEVEEVSLTSLDRRVSVPETGDELTSLATTMNAMLQRLQEAANTQRRFVDDASHELRTPLTNLRAQLEVGQRHPDRIASGQTYNQALAELDRADTLIADLLLLARLDQGSTFSTDRKTSTVGALVEGLLIATHGKTLNLDVDEGSNEIVLPRIVGQVLQNLIDNALIHSQSNPSATISVVDEHFVFIVTDDGPGIPQQDRQRVVRRFERLDHSRDRTTGGTGLGLAIATEITGHLDGTLVIDDRPGAGSGARITVSIPLGLAPSNLERSGRGG